MKKLMIILFAGFLASCEKEFTCQCTTYDKTDGYRPHPSQPFSVKASNIDKASDYCYSQAGPESSSWVEKCYIIK